MQRKKAIRNILAAVCLSVFAFSFGPFARVNVAAAEEIVTVPETVHFDMSMSGSTVIDIAGGHNASVVGTLTSAAGDAGDPTALRGFSKSNYMEFSLPGTMTLSEDFSVSVTFKAATLSGEQALVTSRDIAASKRDFQLFLKSGGAICFYVANAKNSWVRCDGPAVTANEWHTAVASMRQGVMQLFLDGDLISLTVNTGGRYSGNDLPLRIGGDASGAIASGGLISDVVISDSPAECSEVELTVEKQVSVGITQPGNLIFSGRSSVWSDYLPAFFRGMNHKVGTFNGDICTVVKGGILYAVTPKTGDDTRISTLEQLGFTRVTGLDFQAYNTTTSVVTTFYKQVTAGEKLNIHRWAVLISEHLKLNSLNIDYVANWASNSGEVLYNGITLPEKWPPTTIESYGTGEMPVPYLDAKPDVININTGRQLFVDDFLIRSTTLTREWHKAVKYENNPILKPETEYELGREFEAGKTRPAMAAPLSDGVWYDSNERLFKMWYMAGWWDGMALATSSDGIRWYRPDLDVVEGTNIVLSPGDNNCPRDSGAVIYDPYTTNASERYKMFLFQRTGKTSVVYTSADGIHWGNKISVAKTGDRSTMFYNPFRKKWVYSIRSSWYNRSRNYCECDDLAEGADLKGEVNWARADDLDIPSTTNNEKPALYNLDAVAYESLMLGAFTIYTGPANAVAFKGGYPKTTELHLGFSRDGFHWSRSDDRTAFIGCTGEKDSWERGYVNSNAAICMVNDDELWFYYTAFQGDENRKSTDPAITGSYANASTGLAKLRRDGFASMNATGTGTLTTEKVTFDGKYLFVNADAPQGSVRAEILDENGDVIDGFSAADCTPVSGDNTKMMLSFGKDLSEFAGTPVRIRFTVTDGKLYSFWVTDDAVNGASNGYLAGGSVGQDGLVDTAASYTSAAPTAPGLFDLTVRNSRITPMETGNRYSLYCKSQLAGTDAFREGTNDIKVLEYGILYGTGMSVVGEYVAREKTGATTLGLQVRCYPYDASDTGVSRLCSKFSYRFNHLKNNQERGIAAYIRYECDGILYTEYSTVGGAATFAGGYINGVGPVREFPDELDD